MKVNIRPIKFEDAKYIHEIRIMDGVRENILGLTSGRISDSEAFIKGLTDSHHVFVAEIEEDSIYKVVGNVGLVVNRNPRISHSASIGIMVHRDYQGMGIGKALLGKVIDLADNWLMLTRVELGVFTDNEKAIKLYKSFGFEVEGKKKYAIIRNGKYEDEYLMARYKINNR